MLDVIIAIGVFYVVVKLLKGVFGAFSKTDYRRDR
jgi:hypothetical protein